MILLNITSNKSEKGTKNINEENSDFEWEFSEGNDENQADNDEIDYQLLLKNSYHYKSELYEPFI